jgi:starch phosphorylase
MKRNDDGAEPGIEDDRTSLEGPALERAFSENLFYVQGKFAANATRNDLYLALAYTVRDRLLRRWIDSLELCWKSDVRIVSYLSAEFLTGPHLGNNLISLGIQDEMRQALENLGLDLDELLEQEEEPGLGNGGLGRLAACYMDSLATLRVPAMGYGIRY